VVSSQPRPTLCHKLMAISRYKELKVCAKTISVSTQIGSRYDNYIGIS
jgi:hypothetical protein